MSGWYWSVESEVTRVSVDEDMSNMYMSRFPFLSSSHTNLSPSIAMSVTLPMTPAYMNVVPVEMV
jgi:hypothetical protein